MKHSGLHPAGLLADIEASVLAGLEGRELPVRGSWRVEFPMGEVTGLVRIQWATVGEAACRADLSSPHVRLIHLGAFVIAVGLDVEPSSVTCPEPVAAS